MFISGGEAEEPNAEGGPEGKDSKPGLLGGGSSPLNNLPPEIRMAPTLGTFKTQLKTWLYIQAFPPTSI